MGLYINKGNSGFRQARNSEYVDKSGLISVVNGTLFTEQKFSCVTRCRRFGKSMAAKMLAAYFDYSCDSRNLFADLVLIPRKNVDKPAIIIELKKDKAAETGISQIKNRNYPQKVAEYSGDILLVGINYDEETKQHSCKIEHWEKHK